MKYTSNYYFKLPEGGDPVDITVLDDNFKSIDAVLYSGIASASAAARAFTVTATVTTDLWTESISWGKYQASVAIDGVDDTMIPLVMPDGGEGTYTLYEYAYTGDGIVTFYADEIPTNDITGLVVTLIKTGGSASGDLSDASGGTTEFELPIATATTLGGVKIGDGISVADDGTISVDTAAVTETVSAEVIETVAATDDETQEAIDEVFGE